ncbi:MAG TPA: capsule assembly Wzi family protein [Terracidiphilus sp.]
MAQSFAPGWSGSPHTAAPAMITSAQGSTYVPLDHWIYSALDRLHGMGYIDTAFLGLRPWTRLSIAHMLEESADAIQNSSDDEARELFLAARKEVQPDVDNPTTFLHPDGVMESVYVEGRGISGTPLRDSYHLGQSIVNDYGRPYENGFNFYGGMAARAEAGRFSVYFRGEYQHSPSASGYSPDLRSYLSNTTDMIDLTKSPQQETLPEEQILSQNNARLMQGYVSYELLNHEISFGKMEHWLAPDRGGALLISNNAQGMYNFQIDRVEPLRIPGLSRITGPFRYLFYVGSLKGHTDPNAPWAHVEKISFKPTGNIEFGFSRLVIWGGEGHVPITLHSFLKSFFSVANVSRAEKFSRNDPGARFAAFDFNWRLPFMRHWLTLYTDSFVHDDVSPVDAPRRAAYHPGIYLSRFPGLQKLDLRLEGATTDSSAAGARQTNGQFFYWEAVQRQGPTNEGYLMGDPIGRTGKGGQAWMAYHFSPKDEVGVAYRRAKASPQFLPGGTTQNEYAFTVRKWFAKQFQIEGLVQYENWKAPIYKTGAQSDTTTAVKLTWYPPRRD